MHIKQIKLLKTLHFLGTIFWKKVLTNEKWCDIIVKLSPRELGESETVIENWTTRDKYKAKKIVWIISLISERILLKQK